MFGYSLVFLLEPTGFAVGVRAVFVLGRGPAWPIIVKDLLCICCEGLQVHWWLSCCLNFVRFDLSFVLDYIGCVVYRVGLGG